MANNHAILLSTAMQKTNVDALNRTAICTTADLDQGAPVVLALPTTAGDNVFVATPATATDATNGVPMWLAFSPVVDKTVVGDVFGGCDPRYFVNRKGKPFDAVKPEVGDLVHASIDFFGEDYDPDTITTGTVVEYTANGWECKASATSAYKGTRFAIGAKTFISVGGEEVAGWILECVQ